MYEFCAYALFWKCVCVYMYLHSLSTYMCMCVCVYVCMGTWCMCVWSPVSVSVCVSVCVHGVCVYGHMCVCLCVCLCVCVCVCTCTSMCTCVLDMPSACVDLKLSAWVLHTTTSYRFRTYFSTFKGVILTSRPGDSGAVPNPKTPPPPPPPVCVCVCVCVCLCVRACVRACVRVCLWHTCVSRGPQVCSGVGCTQTSKAVRILLIPVFIGTPHQNLSGGSRVCVAYFSHVCVFPILVSPCIQYTNPVAVLIRRESRALFSVCSDSQHGNSK